MFKVLGYPLSIYSDDEGALNSKKIQNYLKGEGTELIITKTHASQAGRMVRTILVIDFVIIKGHGLK